MSELLAQIKDDRLHARKTKNLLKTALLTTLLGDLETGGKQKEVTNQIVISKVKSYLNSIDEILAVEGLNEDATYKANTEKSILVRYLPTLVDSKDVESYIDVLIQDEVDQIGRIMQYCNIRFGDKYDRAFASKYAKSKL